jgi:SAM-dependent methyltransferase
MPKSTNIIAELGCGTGNMTIPLSREGYDMIGIDLSPQMLSKAMDKARAEEQDILFLQQDMREFELYGTVDAIISICDSINYITEPNELLEVFKLVNNYLDPGGLFIFDINTIYKFENILAQNSFCETSDSSAYTWENYYDSETGINEFYTNFFIEDEETHLYSRHEEFHYERGYSIDEITELLNKAGLKLEAVYDELSLHAPTDKSKRIFFVAREIQKGNK